MLFLLTASMHHFCEEEKQSFPIKRKKKTSYFTVTPNKWKNKISKFCASDPDKDIQN